MTYINRMHHAPDYLRLLPGGTRFRMMRLHDKMTAHNINRPPSTSYASWREARAYGFHNWAFAHGAMTRGEQGEGFAKCNVWYCHTGEYFRNERDAQEVHSGLPRGWFTDVDQNETAVGIVAMLTHGRYIAGYRWTSNDERVYFGDVYTDDKEAARVANWRAEKFAEVCRDDDEKFQAARELETNIEDKEARLRECIVMRHHACLSYVRNEARAIIESLRSMRAELANDYPDYAA